jgi:aldose 1-epimerase
VQIIKLAKRRTRAIVVPEAGGRLHQIEIFDGHEWLPLLVAPVDLRKLIEEPLAWGSYVMAPWPGRIDGGRFLWRGRQYGVPANSGDGHALHGRGVYLPWRVDVRTGSSITMSVDFDEAWPFGGSATQEIRVGNRSITQRIEIRAMGEAFPAGAGWHPWFRRDVCREHDAEICVDAGETYELAEMMPTGWLPPVAGDRDLRSYAAVGDRRLDDCYREPRALGIRWGDVEMTMESSANVTHAVVYTPRHAVCIEPQTCAPDAFNLAAQGIMGAGMAVVAPGRPLVAETVWRWRIAE